jgi:hypothetical protein
MVAMKYKLGFKGNYPAMVAMVAVKIKLIGGDNP